MWFLAREAERHSGYKLSRPRFFDFRRSFWKDPVLMSRVVSRCDGGMITTVESVGVSLFEYGYSKAQGRVFERSLVKRNIERPVRAPGNHTPSHDCTVEKAEGTFLYAAAYVCETLRSYVDGEHGARLLCHVVGAVAVSSLIWLILSP